MPGLMSKKKGAAARADWTLASASFVCLIWLVQSLALTAQNPAADRPRQQLNLKHAIELALQHNRQIRLAQLATAESREKLAIARSHYYPHIANESTATYLTDLQGVVLPAGALAHSPSTGLLPAETLRIGQGAHDAFTSGTGLLQPLTQLVKIHAGDKAAQADVKTAQITEEDAENSITLLVYKLYFGILTAQAQLKAGQSAVAAAEKKEEESRRAVAEGRALAVASLQSHAELLDQQQTVLKTRLSVDDLALQLDDALGFPLGTQLDLDSDVLADEPLLPSRAEAMESVLEHNSKVLEAQQTVEKAKAGLVAARAAYIPNITGMARYSYQSGVPFFSHNFGTFGGLVTYDLFEGGERQAEVREARIRLEMAQTQLEQVKSEQSIAMAAAYDQVEVLRQLVTVAAEALRTRVEAARISQERLQQNAEMPSQTAKSQADVAGEQALVLQAQLGLILAQRNIRQILGERP